MKMIKKNKGYSILQVVISSTVFGLSLPVIYGTLMNATVFAVGAKQDIDLQGQSRIAMQRIVNDIKTSRAIFSDDAIPESLKKDLDNMVDNTIFTSPAEDSSAIALMKYNGKVKINEAETDTYRLVLYYLSENNTNASGEYLSLVRAEIGMPRFLVRAESKQVFVASAEESKGKKDKQFLAWSPPDKGISPVFPDKVREIDFSFSKLADNIAPPNASFKGLQANEAGGLTFNKNRNTVNISLMTVGGTPKGFRTLSLQSMVSSRNF